MKKMFFAMCMALLIFGCGDGGSTSADSPPSDGTPEVPQVDADKLDLTTDQYLLTTNGLDSATLTIVTRDASNAALADVVVTLTASAGILSTSQVTTDSTGQATVTFSAGPDKTNQIVNVTAVSGKTSKVLPLTLTGTTLTLNSNKSSLLANVADTATLTVAARDANSNPIPNTDITLTSENGNNLTANGTTASTVTVTTDNNGAASVTMTALNNPGIDTITASGNGAIKSLNINVTSAQFGFTSPADNSTIAVGATTNLVVTYTDALGSPLNGQALTLSTTGGYFDNVIGKTTTTSTTDASGTATISYTASGVASPVDITVSGGAESDIITLLVASIDPSRLDLQASPSILAASIGGVSSSSTITATVRDAGNQLVSGQTVVFTIIDGPGGGESISPGTAVTGAGGTASVTFTSGSAVSAQDGVKIRAVVQSTPTIYADTTLTIGQVAATIVLGDTNKISKVSVDGLEVGYALPFSVLVVDNNGNPIANAVVNLGVYPLHFYTGLVDDTTGKYRNEDENRNGLLDPLEDGAKEIDYITGLETGFYWNDGSTGNPAVVSTSKIGNNQLDPGGVVTIPDSITTDDDGLAAFEIKYAKAYGDWVDVEIKATTPVSGDLSTSKLVVPLSVMVNDGPYLNSPFGW